jgi:hypothetical protein
MLFFHNNMELPVSNSHDDDSDDDGDDDDYYDTSACVPIIKDPVSLTASCGLSVLSYENSILIYCLVPEHYF